MKKYLSMLLAATFICSTLTSCSGDTSSDATSSGGTSSSAPQADPGIYTEVGTYPIFQEGQEKTVSVFMPLRSSVTSYDYNDNAATQWLTDTSGLSFNFETCLEVDVRQKMNTMILGNDYTEIIMFSANYPMSLSEQQLYGMQGTLIPLNDLISEYMPNLTAYLEANPLTKASITCADGNIYALPQAGKATHSEHSQKMWINQTWLDNLGLKLPTTTEEYYEVLKAFKEQDANGNGDPNDEVPLTGSLSGWNSDPLVFLANAFGSYNACNDNAQGLYIDENGKVIFSKVTEEWQETLRYLNRLYEEGLVDNLLFSQTQSELIALGSSPGEALVGSCGGGSIAAFLSIGDSDRWQEYTTVAPLLGPTGVQQAVTEPAFGKSGLVITDKCEDPIAVVRAFDLNYTIDGILANRIGVEGTDYVLAESDAVNYIDEEATYTRLTNASTAGNNTWANAGPWGLPENHDLFYSAGMNIENVLYNETVDKYQPYAYDDSTIIVPLAFTEEQSMILVEVELPMDIYISKATVEFITGTRDIDADWDTYVADVQQFGLSNYLDVYQEAVDAQNK